MTATSQTIDITGWDPRKVEGYLQAVRGDTTAVEVSLVVDTDGQQQMVMALTDDPASDYVARRCEVCQSVTAAKVLPIPNLPGLNAPKTLDVGDETDDESKRTHDRRNGNGSPPH